MLSFATNNMKYVPLTFSYTLQDVFREFTTEETDIAIL